MKEVTDISELKELGTSATFLCAQEGFRLCLSSIFAREVEKYISTLAIRLS